MTSAVHRPTVHGPGETITLLFDDDRATSGHRLPSEFQQVYGGDWVVPPAGDRPYTAVNFVVSRDGRISYAEPGDVGGAPVAGGSAADVWLMGLLRARCDAVLMGDGTVRAEPDHRWTVEHLGGVDVEAFRWLRAAEGRSPTPVQAICSLDGRIEPHWAVVADESLDLVVATTEAGAVEARRRLAGRPQAEIVSFGASRVDTAALARWLRAERGVSALLCEGGPGLYASMVADGAVDDEFATLSPMLIGSHASSGGRRPSLLEGVGFVPWASPRAVPISLRRAGDHLLLRSRVTPGLAVPQSL
jgi:riboflavin biosynthesis pyrimidine reductase